MEETNNTGQAPQHGVTEPYVEPNAEERTRPIVEGEEPIKDIQPPVVDNIAERLANKESIEKEEQSPEPKADSNPIDFNNLSREQIQTLQAVLNQTPEKLRQAGKKPTVTLRTLEGKFVIDFGRARMGTAKDPVTGREVDRQFIPVTLQGEDKERLIKYSDFINLERVVCTVEDHRSKEEEIIEGETFNQAEQRMVELQTIVKLWWFTIKTPDGQELEIEGRIANA